MICFLNIGDGNNYPNSLDMLVVNMKSTEVYQDGLRALKIPQTRTQFRCGLSGHTVHVQVNFC